MPDRDASEGGSALITTMFIAVIITSLLAILLAFTVQKGKLVHRKTDFLQAKYSCESAIEMELAALERSWPGDVPMAPGRSSIAVAPGDTVSVFRSHWGAWLYLHAFAKRRSQAYSLGILAGMARTNVFANGLVINPENYALIVTGDTRLECDVLVGRSGVREDALRGKPYTGGQLVYGAITRSEVDLRPKINTEFLAQLMTGYRRLSKTGVPWLEDGTGGPTDEDGLRSAGGRATYSISAAALREGLEKPDSLLTLLVREPLVLDSACQLPRYVQIICSETVTVTGAARLRDALIYSGKDIIVDNPAELQGQLFAEGGILVRRGSTIEYPSLLLAWPASDTASIRIENNAVVNGFLFYVTPEEYASNRSRLGKIYLEKGSVVNGLVYSDHLITHRGRMNGTIVTDRFYFYFSPTNYYNWLRDATISRDFYPSAYALPLFLKLNPASLKTLQYSE